MSRLHAGRCSGREVGINPAAAAAIYEKAKKVFKDLEKAYAWLTKKGGVIDFLTGGPKKRARARRDQRRLRLASWAYSVMLNERPDLFFNDKKKFEKKLIRRIQSPIKVPGTDIRGPTLSPDVADWVLWDDTGLSGRWLDQLKKFLVSTPEGRKEFDALKARYGPQPAPRPRATVRLTPPSPEPDAEEPAPARKPSKKKQRARKRKQRAAREKSRKKEKAKRKRRREKARAREQAQIRRQKKRRSASEKARRKAVENVPANVALNIEKRKRGALDEVYKLFRAGKTDTAKRLAEKLADI